MLLLQQLLIDTHTDKQEVRKGVAAGKVVAGPASGCALLPDKQEPLSK